MEDIKRSGDLTNKSRVTGSRVGYLKVLESIGVRRLYLFIAGSVQEPVLPTVAGAPTTKGWDEEQLEERLSGSRYFRNANLIRAALHVPVIVFGALHGYESLISVFAALALGHLLLALVESYKSGIVRMMPPDEDGVEVSEFVPANFGERWFAPKRWETDRLYGIIGIKPFQALTTFLIKHIWLTKDERKAGKQVEYLRSMSPTKILRFENATRVGEMVHLSMGAIDAVPLILAIWLGAHPAWIAYFVWIFWGDTWLGFLQRYHRLRVWKLVERSRRKLEARGDASA